MTTDSRTPAGQPTGGQFAAQGRDEALIELAAAIGPPACRVCGSSEDVEEQMNFVMHPLLSAASSAVNAAESSTRTKTDSMAHSLAGPTGLITPGAPNLVSGCESTASARVSTLMTTVMFSWAKTIRA
ncbi:hypothetical protein [Rhodoglobus vestalii]|nr:hypothetical protein [Rhodoglobus vestalii]